MPKFGIIAALEREVEPFIRNCTITHRMHDGRSYRAFERGETVVICGGIGRQAARRATEALIALYRPEIVQSVGYAGALKADQSVGTIIRPARVIDTSDCSSIETGEGRGVLVTIDTVASPDEKSKLADRHGADAVDMEAAAVAKGAEVRGVRFQALKVVSDELDFEMPATAQFVTHDGQFRAGWFAWFAAFRPWMWGTAILLARNSTIATRALCGVLEKDFAMRSREVM